MAKIDDANVDELGMKIEDDGIDSKYELSIRMRISSVLIFINISCNLKCCFTPKS